MSRLAMLAVAFLLTATARAEEAKPVDPNSSDFLATIVGAPKDKPLTGDALDRRTEEVSRDLRCPVCQGSSVGDSPSSTARHMKQQVREALAAGYSEEQVLLYFESSYGEFVRFKPKAEGFTTLVWIAPALLFVIGGLIAAAWFRKRTRRAGPAAAVPTEPQVPEHDPDLDRWLNEVRTIVDDGPGSTGEAR